MTEQFKHVARLALGTAQFGLPYGVANQDGQVTRSAAKAMLQLAAENGIDTLDTAIAYGESETCLGEVGTQGFKLVTKLPAVPDSCADVSGWVQEQVAASLARLGVNAVYGLLLHRPEQLLGTDGKTLYQTLQGLKETGQVQKVGVSIYAPNELEVLTPQYRFDLVQAPFNLVDRRLHTSGWLQRLKGDGVEIHVRSVFLQGLLLMDLAERPEIFNRWQPLWGQWHRWLDDVALTPLQACLGFALAQAEIDRIVVGVDNLKHLQDIVASLKPITIEFPKCLENADLALINPSKWSKL
ncbi:MAG: aldo/keto reductase [Sulfuricella sp.]|nr:aldo/keto reductase [Sulfuricella sp.]